MVLSQIKCRLGNFDESKESVYLLNKYKTGNWKKLGRIYEAPLCESIHYKCLLENNFEDYSIYIDVTKQSPISGQEAAKNFINYYSKRSLDDILELLNNYKVNIKNFVIQDGLHRLSTILYLTNNDFNLDENLIK